mgnify:CR=1 FL=1|jgi:hypothetical protein
MRTLEFKGSLIFVGSHGGKGLWLTPGNQEAFCSIQSDLRCLSRPLGFAARGRGLERRSQFGVSMERKKNDELFDFGGFYQ